MSDLLFLSFEGTYDEEWIEQLWKLTAERLLYILCIMERNQQNEFYVNKTLDEKKNFCFFFLLYSYFTKYMQYGINGTIYNKYNLRYI